MNRLEFMKQLARLLDDLPREEKIEVLKYYNGYFDDAGAENEAEIIAQLGSPEKVAAEVKAGMEDAFATEEPEESQREASQENQESSRNVEPEMAPEFAPEPVQVSNRRKKKDGWKPLLIAVLFILTFRFWFGLAAGLFGLAMGLIGLLVGLVGAVVGCVVSGVVMLVTAPLTGILSLAVGIFLIGLLLLVGLLVGLVFGKLIPFVINGIRKLVCGVSDAVGGIWEGFTGRG
ncbi:MAG: DUF1700 domain-containing protein [Lachnospiraceae bacterium]|nr:DUF1700 domain-containing protein [Lachnospiraceae bacterium]